MPAIGPSFLTDIQYFEYARYKATFGYLPTQYFQYTLTIEYKISAIAEFRGLVKLVKVRWRSCFMMDSISGKPSRTSILVP